MRTFALVRDVDETGISGTGRVAEGVVFSDGTCALRWCSKHTSTAVYDSLEDLDAIHGHGGKTRIVFDGAVHELREPATGDEEAWEEPYRGV